MATLREDAVAGLVLGVQSVPDGLATGLLAGVNPLSGLYAYLVGTFTGALVTSSSFMAIQGTGAMAMIVADVPAVHTATDAERALFTLSVLTGLIMLAAGLLRLGWVLLLTMLFFSSLAFTVLEKALPFMPVRAASVWRQISARADRNPLSAPSVNGELANKAVATDCSATETRNFLTMSASLAKSRFTCTVAVRYIMSRPYWPTFGM